MAEGFAGEIAEQPGIAELLAGDRRPVAEAADAIRGRRPLALILVGRGSSHHAAVYGRYLFEIRNRLPASIAAPSVYTLYGRSPRLSRMCAIGISQSGRSPDVTEVLREAGRNGALTVAITNDDGSELATVADHVLPCRAGPETSVPASKTYLASLVRLVQLSEALDPEPTLAEGIARLYGILTEVLAVAETGVERIVKLLDAPPLVIGRGYQLGAALETALKITETSGAAAQAFSEADFLHGPIAAVAGRRPVLMMEPTDRTLVVMRQLAARLRERGASLAHVTELPQTRGSEPELVLPAAPHEALSPITYAPVGQLLALQLARARGLDPDRPPGLTKVTVTV